MHEGEGIFDLEVLQGSQKAYVATLGSWSPEYHDYGWLYSINLTAMKVKTVPIDGGALCLEASANSNSLYVGTGWPMPNHSNIVVVDTESDDIAARAGSIKSERE